MPQQKSERLFACFEPVRRIALGMRGVAAAVKYDGSPVLKVGGCFMAGVAMHPSAEPDSLVVRVNLEDRSWLLHDAPDSYYVTDYYRKYPVVLVRLSQVGPEALRDLLSVSRRLALAKSPRGGKRKTTMPAS